MPQRCLECGRKIRFRDNRDYCTQCSNKNEQKIDMSSNTNKILIVIDYHGWAFDFVARGIKKYSKHECVIKRWNELNVNDAKEHNVVFFMNSSCYEALKGHRQTFHSFEKSNIKKCVGIRATRTDCDQPIDGWNIGCVSQRIYDELRLKGIPKLFLTRNGVDTDIFKPVERPIDRFVVGWAGNSRRPEKRYHLLRQINFPLAVQTKWGLNFFVKERNRDEMIEFYSKIDVFINVSDREGMPQTILEAAATKLPIIATDVGGIPDFVDSEWIIPFPEKECIKTLNKKLQILKDDPKLRFEVGERNLQKCLSSWNWKYIAKEYDKMFEE